MKAIIINGYPVDISVSPYEFDTIWTGVPVFTDKNIALITAMVNNDSAYRLSFDPKWEKSSARFLSKGFPKKDDVLEAVTLIDQENSTHISSTGSKKGSGGGREIVAKYIIDHYESIKSQIKNGETKVVNELSLKPVKGRANISFASKFCVYVNRYCFDRDYYSIVDNVLLQVLPAYEAIYLRRSVDKRKWLRQQEKAKESPFPYDMYNDAIGEILDNINKSGYLSAEVSRKEFDLLLWYYYKGSDDRIRALYEAVNRYL